jgi:hypothetical protein
VAAESVERKQKYKKRRPEKDERDEVVREAED